jgi:hypothetical protein
VIAAGQDGKPFSCDSAICDPSKTPIATSSVLLISSGVISFESIRHEERGPFRDGQEVLD